MGFDEFFMGFDEFLRFLRDLMGNFCFLFEDLIDCMGCLSGFDGFFSGFE